MDFFSRAQCFAQQTWLNCSTKEYMKRQFCSMAPTEVTLCNAWQQPMNPRPIDPQLGRRLRAKPATKLPALRMGAH